MGNLDSKIDERDFTVPSSPVLGDSYKQTLFKAQTVTKEQLYVFFCQWHHFLRSVRSSCSLCLES